MVGAAHPQQEKQGLPESPIDNYIFYIYISFKLPPLALSVNLENSDGITHLTRPHKHTREPPKHSVQSTCLSQFSVYSIYSTLTCTTPSAGQILRIHLFHPPAKFKRTRRSMRRCKNANDTLHKAAIHALCLHPRINNNPQRQKRGSYKGGIWLIPDYRKTVNLHEGFSGPNMKRCTWQFLFSPIFLTPFIPKDHFA